MRALRTVSFLLIAIPRGEATIDGEWAGRVTGLRDARVVNALAYLRVTFAVDDRRRHARPAPEARRAAPQQRGGPVRRDVSTPLRPRHEGLLIGLARELG